MLGNGYGQNNVSSFLRLFHLHPLFSKPKTHKGKQFLDERAPKLVENTKKTMFVKGTKTSEIVTRAMTDLVSTTSYEFIIALGRLLFISTC